MMQEESLQGYAFLCMHILRLLWVEVSCETKFRTMNLRQHSGNILLGEEVIRAALQNEDAPRSRDRDFPLLLQQLRAFRKTKGLDKKNNTKNRSDANNTHAHARTHSTHTHTHTHTHTQCTPPTLVNNARGLQRDPREHARRPSL